MVTFLPRFFEIHGAILDSWAELGWEGRTLRVEGAPIEWVVPGNARASRFIAKLNVNAVILASDGSLSETDEWAFASRPHPEDVGTRLTRAERQTLIRAVDLGAQYHSRRNVGGGGFTGMEYPP